MRQTKQNKNKSSAAWGRSLTDPFYAPAAHIPDFETNASGLITSTTFFQHTPCGLSGTAATHNGGIVVFPYARGHIYELAESVTGTANMTDLNASQTSWYGGRDAANISGFGDLAKHRMTACGVRITFAGAEQNRSGEYIAGYVQNDYPAYTTTAGTALSPLSTLMGSNVPMTFSVPLIQTALKEYDEARIGDKTFEFHWKPNGVPPYQLGGANVAYTAPATVAAGVRTASPSLWSAAQNDYGLQAGSNCLVILIRGDTTATATSLGNVYDVQVTSHWEVIPSTPTTVVYDITPSFSNPAQLASAMNSISANNRPISNKIQPAQQPPPTVVQPQMRGLLDNDLVRELGMRALRVAAGVATRKLAVRSTVPPSRRLEF